LSITKFSFLWSVETITTKRERDMKNSNVLTPVQFTEINDLTDFSLVTFDGGCVSWTEGIWTISRVTEKAILIDDEWIPKSQIVDVVMVERKYYDGENNFELVTIPQLTISSWFDKTNSNKRQKGYAF
jgi:hypothetical protein